MIKFLKLGFVFSFIVFPLVLQASQIQGTVRSINYESRSFSVDGPPLQRVWVNHSTRFDISTAPNREGGIEAFRSIRDGDRVLVEGFVQSHDIFVARTVKLLKAAEDSAGDPLVNLGQSFTLEINQKVKIRGENLTLKAVEIIDTLCKEGANCEGEGSVGIRLRASKGSEQKDILLSSFGGRKPVNPVVMEALGYKISLIEMGEYAAILVVRK